MQNLLKKVTGLICVMLVSWGMLMVTPASAKMHPLKYQTDYSGNDILTICNAESAEKCSEFCNKYNDCMAMTFNVVNHNCYLKNPVAEATYSKNGISATKVFYRR